MACPARGVSGAAASDGPVRTDIIAVVMSAHRMVALAPRALGSAVGSPFHAALASLEAVPALAGSHQTLEQRRWAPARTMGCGEALHGVDHALQSRLLGPVHRSAFVGRKPITIDVDDVDVARADGDALRDD